MAKEQVKQNSKGEQGKVLEVSAPAPAPQKAVGENGTRKKNQAIEVEFQDKEGKKVAVHESAVLKVTTKAGVDILDLAKLPKAMLIAAAAFGLNTRIRNAHNSAEHSGSDGIAAMKGTIASIMAGEWRAAGEGGEEGTPLVIESMIRAKRDAGKYVEGMESKWLDHYRSLDKDGKAQCTKDWLKNEIINAAFLKIKAERAVAKAQTAGSKAGSADLDF